MVDVKLLLDKFKNIRSLTEELVQPLQLEDYIPQPILDVSPPKWHLGHTTWFYEIFILEKYIKNYKTFNPTFHYIFNSYYESQGKRILRATRGNMSRPTLDEILKYRKHVTEHMVSFLETQTEIDRQLWIFLNIGMNHEQQHQELLVYDFKYILGHNPLFPTYSNNQFTPQTNIDLSEKFIDIKEGVYEIGHNPPNGEFCFDNEMPRHKIYLNPYRIQDRLVTNGEFLEFLEEGAYQNWEHWLEEGWTWVKEQKIDSPQYWHKVDDEWHYYTLNGFRKLDLNSPVSHVSFFEAEAYARWKGKRLPFEGEWEIAATELCPSCELDSNFAEQKNFETIERQNNSNQFWGDCWEWTFSNYSPYPGYKQGKGALGEYNGKFMVNQMVLKGGSYATPLNHFRTTYRNFFQTDKRWVISGFRLAETID